MRWVCCCLVTKLCPTQVPLPFSISQSLLKFMSIESLMPSHISSAATLYSFCLQSFLASESFLVSRLFASGGQSIRDSASASVLPMNIQDWLPLGLTGWISLQSKGLSTVKSFLQHHSSKASILWCSAFFMVQLTSTHDYWRNHSFDYADLCWQSNVSAF